MPYLYDPSQSINMLQSGLGQGLSQRTQFGYNVHAQKEKEWQQLKADQKAFNQTIGQQFAKLGTLAQGGDPENPGVLGQGYFNTKLAGWAQKKRNDILGEAVEKQNSAASIIDSVVEQKTAPATAPATATTAPVTGAGDGIMNLPDYPHTGAGGDTVQNLLAATGNATQIVGGQVTAGAGYVPPASPSSVTSANAKVNEATAHAKAMAQQFGPDSDQAIEARSNAALAVKAASGAQDEQDLRDLQKRGGAAAIYSDGKTDINLVENPVTGQPELVATIAGESFAIDAQTAQVISGLIKDHEGLTNTRIAREATIRRYEDSRHATEMEKTINGSVNNAYWEGYPKSRLSDESVAAIESLRSMFPNISQGQLKQIIQDFETLEYDAMTSGATDSLDMFGLNEHVFEGVSNSIRESIKHNQDDAKERSKLATTEYDAHVEKLSALQEELDEALLSYGEGSPEANAILNEIANEKRHGLELNSHKNYVQNDMDRYNHEYVGRWRDEYPTRDLTYFAGRMDSGSPVRNIVESTLIEQGFYNPEDGSFNFIEGDTDSLMRLIPFFQKKASDLGWTISAGSQEESDAMEQMWMFHLQNIGADVNPERVIELQQGLEDAALNADMLRQERIETGQTTPTTAPATTPATTPTTAQEPTPSTQPPPYVPQDLDSLDNEIREVTGLTDVSLFDRVEHLANYAINNLGLRPDEADQWAYEILISFGVDDGKEEDATRGTGAAVTGNLSIPTGTAQKYGTKNVQY